MSRKFFPVAKKKKVSPNRQKKISDFFFAVGRPTDWPTDRPTAVGLVTLRRAPPPPPSCARKVRGPRRVLPRKVDFRYTLQGGGRIELLSNTIQNGMFEKFPNFGLGAFPSKWYSTPPKSKKKLIVNWPEPARSRSTFFSISVEWNTTYWGMRPTQNLGIFQTCHFE